MDIQDFNRLSDTVGQFLGLRGGHIVAGSEDARFIGMLRAYVTKDLGIVHECLSTAASRERIPATVAKALGAGAAQVLLVMESFLDHKSTSYVVRGLRQTHGDELKIVILTGDLRRERLILFHDVGADSFITRPFSLNSVVEKLAATLQPQGRLARLLAMGKELLAGGQGSQAEELARRILDKKPDHAGALLLLGDALLAQDRREAAVAALEEAWQATEVFLEPLKRLAELHHSGDKAERLRYLEMLDELSPLNVDRKVDIGGLHVDMGNQDKAAEVFDQAVRLAGREVADFVAEVSGRIGELYAETHPELAERYLSGAMEIARPEGEEGLARIINYGVALRRQGKWREAVAAYEKARPHLPKDAGLLYNLAMAYAEGRNFTRASDMLSQALDIDTGFHEDAPGALYNMAYVFANAGEPGRGRDFALMALKAAPGHAKSRELLAGLPAE